MTEHQRGYIYVQQGVTLEALQQLLKLELPWAYVASPTDAQIVVATPALPQSWPQGRAFGPALEIRWRQAGTGFDVEVLTEQEPPSLPAGEWQRTSPEIDGAAQRTLLLWGERGKDAADPREWVTIRIPRALSYPVDNTALTTKPAQLRVVIQAYDYTIAAQPVATRWTQLAPATARKGG